MPRIVRRPFIIRGFDIFKYVFEIEMLLKFIPIQNLEDYRIIHEEIYQIIKDLPYDITDTKPNLYTKICSIGDAFIQSAPLNNFVSLKNDLQEELI